MDTKKLRQKILDLAIHGKLVPQDPNDEPASVLLERIRAEKEQLIKAGKIKRSKKSIKTSDTPHYEQVPFEVPEGWVWTTIESVCSKIGSGSTPKGSNYSENGIPFFRSQNVYNHGLVYDDIKYISPEIHHSMIGTEVIANDVLLNITGGSLGRCAIVPNDFKRGNVSQHVCIMRPVIVLKEYLHAFVLSSLFAKTMKITGSGREGLPKYNLERMSFPLPPLAEQRRIVAEIDKWLAMVDIIEQGKDDLQAAIAQAKSKILDLAIHGKLVPQDPSDEPAIELLRRINPKFTPCDNGQYGQLPQGWVWCKINDLRQTNGTDSFADGPFGSNLKREHQTSKKEVRIIQLSNIGDNGWKDDNAKFTTFEHLKTIARCEVQPNDFVIAKMMPAGRTIIMPELGTKIVLGSDVIRFVPNSELHKKYLLSFMQSQLFLKQVAGDVHGIGRLRTSLSKLKECVVPIPPICEQQRITEKIDLISNSLDSIQSSIEAQ